MGSVLLSGILGVKTRRGGFGQFMESNAAGKDWQLVLALKESINFICVSSGNTCTASFGLESNETNTREPCRCMQECQQDIFQVIMG